MRINIYNKRTKNLKGIWNGKFNHYKCNVLAFAFLRDLWRNGKGGFGTLRGLGRQNYHLL